MTFVIAGALELKKGKTFLAHLGLSVDEHSSAILSLQPSLCEGRMDNLPMSLKYVLVKAQAILAKYL